MTPPLILVLGTAEWNAPIATNQHYVTRELAVEFPIVFAEGVGTRRPSFSKNDLKRIARRLAKVAKRSDSSRNDGPTRPVPTNVEIVSPFAVPFHVKAMHGINSALLQKAFAKWINYDGPKVLWSYTPFTYGLESHADFTVYHLVDLLHENPGASRTDIFRSETALAKRADLAIATSPAIGEHLTNQGFKNVEVKLNVADVEVFEKARGAAKEVPPVVIFAGNLRADKLDVELLKDLAIELKDKATLRLIGPSGLEPGERSFLDELRDLGADVRPSLPLEDLAVEIAKSTVGIIPYRINALTRGISPLKTYEYLAAGVPVVSTPLPSMVGKAVEIDGLTLATENVFTAACSELVVTPRAALVPDGVSWIDRGRVLRSILREAFGPGRGGSMRIHLAVRSTRPFVLHGGLERASSDLTRAFAENGYLVSVYTPMTSVRQDDDAADYVDLPWPKWAHGRKAKFLFPLAYFVWNARVGKAINSQLKADDVVYLHGVSVGAAKKLKSCRGILFNPHGMEEFGTGRLMSAPTRFALRWIIRRSVPFADHVIATDRTLIPEAMRNLGVKRADVILIPNGIDPDRGNALADAWTGVRPKGWYLSSIGRLSHNKGFDLLATAVTKLDKSGDLPSDWSWYHFGSGAEAGRVTAILDRDGLSPRFHLRESASDEEVHANLAGSAIYVQPSRYEGSSLTTLEAMSHSLLIVGTPAGGIPEKVIEGNTGILASEASSDAIAEAIRRAIQLDASTKTRLGHAARGHLVSSFSLQSAVAKYRSVFSALGSGNFRAGDTLD